MTLTQNWNANDYYNYIIKNGLDELWTSWCNPKSINGIRLVAYSPIYKEEEIETYNKKCTKEGCDGKLIVPLDQRLNKVIYKRVCNGTINGSACGAYNSIIWRWVSKYDHTKNSFDNVDTTRKYAMLGRTFYTTLAIYDERIRPDSITTAREDLWKAYSLGIDIDIIRGTICDMKNREELTKTLNVVREWLNVICPNSYNIQTSGNGIQILIHHNICTKDIFQCMSRFNAYIRYLNDIVLKKENIKGIKIDPINMRDRLFKMIGSIHHKHDLVCIPLHYDVDLTKMYSDEFKLEHFDINKYRINNKLDFYNRYDKNDEKSLYKFLFSNEQINSGKFYGMRALRHKYTENEANNAITGGSTELNDKNDSSTKIDDWIRYDAGISGSVIYRINEHKELEIEMLGVDRKNKELRNKIIKGIETQIKNNKL